VRIVTLPVYSKLADDQMVEQAGLSQRLPPGWRLSQHQVETYQALTDPDGPDVIFNTAMTGDGKSLAGQLPTLLKHEDSPLFAMYPTNELVYDQEKQWEQTQHKWSISGLYKSPLDSAKLDRLMEGGDFTQRGEALLDLIYNYDVLLTNPDIFHYIMEHFYRFPKDAADKIIGPLVDKFKQFTFDEFHIFETPQVISVVNAMLFINEMTGIHRPRYLFLSATPSEQMLEFLERSGLRYIEINPAQNGWYAHSSANPDEACWRSILHGSDIHFANGGAEEWVEAHVYDVMLPFFLDHQPNVKGAVIVNSVATAMRLQTRLAPLFREYGLTVKPNTGLTSRSGRIDSYEADLLIGTSTVDVGVDFNINFLLFESLNAGTFLQRLGRLGRHSGYTRGGHTYTFERYEAHALVPQWITETLFEGRDGAQPLLTEGVETTREHLAEAIQQAYPPAASFDGYVRDWGKFQSLNVIMNLNNPTIKTQYSETRDRLGQRYQHAFNIKLDSAYAHWKQLKEAGYKLLVDEALSFRGGSYFQCAILDRTEGDFAQPKLYDLFTLVANGKLGALDEGEFYDAVERADSSKRQFRTANGNTGPLAYFRLDAWRVERNDYQLYLGHDIMGWSSDKFDQTIVVKGFELLATDVPNPTALRNSLRRRQLPATLCLAYQHPLELKRRLYLPPLFSVYRFTSRDGVSGCVAFGREALLLHTRLKCRQVNSGGAAIIC
jgi:CRISPR-associated endonuclease/helicase Cas3